MRAKLAKLQQVHCVLMSTVKNDAVALAAATTTVMFDGDNVASLVGSPRRALLGSYLNSDPNNQVYVFIFVFTLILFSVPPLLRLKHFFLVKTKLGPELWDFEQEMPDLVMRGGQAPLRTAQD